ncbi:MAG TPA: 50S ribosomal protein L17, partial [Synergistaceae bacterium]|nr:50S ribosomal protein L17 [Synergistaceae bacterium]
RLEAPLPRAKELPRFAGRLVAKAKRGGLHNRRLLASRMPDKAAVKKLFDELAPRYESRNGGYTRIVKTGFRHGDSSPMAVIELVEES